MKVLKFKTNIENDEMAARLANVLDKEEKVSKWNIDTENQYHILSVSGEELTPDDVSKAVSKAGFEAEVIRVTAVGGHDL